MIHRRRRSAIAALILAAGLSACGDEGPTAPPEPTYHLDGTIASGDFPSVSFDIIPTLCPNLAETWSGTFDQTTRVLNVRGTVNIFDVDSCEDLLLFTGPLSLAQ